MRNAIRSLFLGAAVALALLVASTPAQAGGFVGASYGYTDWESSVSGISFNDDDSGWKVWGGFGAKYFGVEASYVDFGDFASASGTNQSIAELSAWDGFFYGRFPIKFFEVFGKVGFSYWDRQQSVVITTGLLPGAASVSDTGTDFVWGLGIGFNFGKHVGIRLEYEDFDIEDDSVNLSSLGVIVRF